MSSFLDCEYEWPHRPDETTISLANPISSTSSDGLLPSPVGSCSYGTISQHSENDVSPAVAAAAAAAAAAIKSEQAMLLDDDETADDDNDTAGSRYKNYDDDNDFDFDFDSSDDEAIIARTKMAAKKKKKKKHIPHSSDATTTSDRNGHSILREELVTNKNNAVPMTTLTRTTSNTSNEVEGGKCSSTSCLLLDGCKDDGMMASISRDDDHGYDNDDIGDDHGDERDNGRVVSGTANSEQRFDSIMISRPRNTKTTKSTNSIASDGGIHKNVPQGHAKTLSKISTKWEKKRQQLADFKRKFRHTNVPQTYAENKPLGTWVHNQRSKYKLFKAKIKSPMTRERIQSLDKLDFEWERNTTRTWEESRQQLVDFKREFRHTNVPQTYAGNKPLGIWVNNQRTQYKLFKEKRKSSMTRERIQSLDELDFEWERNITRTWEESRQQLADFKVKFRHTNVPRDNAENKPLGTWVNTQRTQYKLLKAKRKSSMTRERIQSLDELDFEWQVRTRSSSSSLVEKSILSTEDGYESDNSELYLII